MLPDRWELGSEHDGHFRKHVCYILIESFTNDRLIPYRMWKTGAHSDFIVKAGGQSFNVHKAM